MRKMNLINRPVYNKEHLEVTGQLEGLLKLIMQPITLILQTSHSCMRTLILVGHAVFPFLRKINSRPRTAEADRILLQYCLNLEFMHLLCVFSFCRELRI